MWAFPSVKEVEGVPSISTVGGVSPTQYCTGEAVAQPLFLFIIIFTRTVYACNPAYTAYTITLHISFVNATGSSIGSPSMSSAWLYSRFVYSASFSLSPSNACFSDA